MRKMSISSSRRIVGKHLNRIRKEAGLSQMDLARSLGYSSKQIVSNWERGCCDVPVCARKKLVKVLGISDDDMRTIVTAEWAVLLNQWGLS